MSAGSVGQSPADRTDLISTDIVSLTGLSTPQEWRNPARLIAAKAKVRLADLHPVHKEALKALDEALEWALVEALEAVERVQRVQRQQTKVRELVNRWELDKITLNALWRDLRDLDEDPQWDRL